jgi:hypothetical protein
VKIASIPVEEEDVTLTAQEEIARELARDIVVAWLSHTPIHVADFDHSGDKIGRFIGGVYKEVVAAIVQSEEIAGGIKN